jgi:hypothetical protein
MIKALDIKSNEVTPQFISGTLVLLSGLEPLRSGHIEVLKLQENRHTLQS